MEEKIHIMDATSLQKLCYHVNMDQNVRGNFPGQAPVLPLNQSLSLAHAQFAHTVFTITLLHLLLHLTLSLRVWGWTLVKVHV